MWRGYDLLCKTILPIIPQVKGGLSQQNPFRLLRSVRLPREEHEMPSLVPVTNNNCFVKIARNRQFQTTTIYINYSDARG